LIQPPAATRSCSTVAGCEASRTSVVSHFEIPAQGPLTSLAKSE
jgi:hypothetical protein